MASPEAQFVHKGWVRGGRCFVPKISHIFSHVITSAIHRGPQVQPYLGADYGCDYTNEIRPKTLGRPGYTESCILRTRDWGTGDSSSGHISQKGIAAEEGSYMDGYKSSPLFRSLQQGLPRV